MAINAQDIRRFKEQAEREAKIVKDRESRLLKLEKAFKAAEQDIERSRLELETKAAHMHNLEIERKTNIPHDGASIARLKEELLALERDLERRKREFTAKKDEIRRFESADKSGSAREQNSRIATLKDELARAKGSLEQRKRELSEKGSEIRQQEAEIIHLRSIAQRDSSELQAMQQALTQQDMKQRRPPPGRIPPPVR